MSCRRGTPRNDCGCCKSLAEKVRELWERCANVIKSINGINPDGANNFDILPGAGIQVNPRANGIEIVATGAAPEDVVKSVNGTTPDTDGDVQIDTGLLTVNTIAPDADGEFSITAGSGIQINAGTNGIEIENTSQGGTYTGVSPIEINASNEISLKDWSYVPYSNWPSLVSDFVVQKDLIVGVGHTNGAFFLYIPKGEDSRKYYSIYKYDTEVIIQLSALFVSGGSYSGSNYTNKITNNTTYYTLQIMESSTKSYTKVNTALAPTADQINVRVRA